MPDKNLGTENIKSVWTSTSNTQIHSLAFYALQYSHNIITTRPTNI